MKIIDLDGDSKPEIMYPSFTTNTWLVLKNRSTPGLLTPESFSVISENATQAQPCGIAVTDLDNDGLADVIIANDSSHSFSFYRCTDEKKILFEHTNDVMLEGSPDPNILIYDINSDGKQDIISILENHINLDNNSISAVILACTNNAGIFEYTKVYQTPNLHGKQSLSITDIDSDGIIDLISTDRDLKLITVLSHMERYSSDLFVTVIKFIALVGILIGGGWYVNNLRWIRKTKINRIVTRELIEREEAERKRIALELHDSIAQSLLVIKNRVTLGMNASGENYKVIKQLQEIQETTDEALKEIRQISHNLRPHQLDRLGLKDTLLALYQRFAETTSIVFQFDIMDTKDILTKEMEIHLFRIIQEALNNIIKHSNATSAEITLNIIRHSIYLVINDNGQGFIKPALSQQSNQGLGMKSMKERVDILQGKISIDSSQTGTKIIISIPIGTTS